LKITAISADINLYYYGCNGEHAIGSCPRGWIMSRKVVSRMTAESPGVLGRL